MADPIFHKVKLDLDEGRFIESGKVGAGKREANTPTDWLVTTSFRIKKHAHQEKIQKISAVLKISQSDLVQEAIDRMLPEWRDRVERTPEIEI